MKTLTEIALESGFYPHEDQFCVYYADEDTLQAFVDAVNAQNSEQEAVPENFDDWLQMIKTEALLGAAREARLEDDIRTLHNQLAERDALIKCAIELRKWVADGEFSDDSGIFPNCATEEYIEAVQKFDDAVNAQNNEREWYSHDISYFTLLPAFVGADNSQNSEAAGEIVEEYRIRDCYLGKHEHTYIEALASKESIDE